MLTATVPSENMRKMKGANEKAEPRRRALVELEPETVRILDAERDRIKAATGGKPSRSFMANRYVQERAFALPILLEASSLAETGTIKDLKKIAALLLKCIRGGE